MAEPILREREKEAERERERDRDEFFRIFRLPIEKIVDESSDDLLTSFSLTAIKAHAIDCLADII